MSFAQFEVSGSSPSPDASAKSKRPDLKRRVQQRQEEVHAKAEARAAEAQRTTQAEAARTREISEAFENAERAQQIREALAHGNSAADHPLLDARTPIETRRGQAERQSSQLMEHYLRLKKEIEKLPKPKTEEEASSPLLTTANLELAKLSRELDAALLRESLVETEDPAAAYAQHRALQAEKMALETRLSTDEDAQVLRKKLDQMIKKQGEEHLLPSMIKALPKSEQAEAQRWYEMEKASLLEQSHVDRLRTWHRRKSELDLAKVDLVAHCKTCNIPDEARKAFQNPNLNVEDRDKALLQILPSIDRPRTLKEWGVFLGIKAARALGREPGRAFANSELHEHMDKIQSLEAAFNAVADTKGAFIGRRTPYQSSRDSSLVSRSGLGYAAVQKEAVIGDRRFQSADAGTAESYATLETLTHEAETSITALKTTKTLTQPFLEDTARSIKSLKKRLHALDKTFAADSGEYQVAKETIASAETVLQLVQDTYTAEQEEKKKHEREIEFANDLTNAARELAQEISEKDGSLLPVDLSNYQSDIKALEGELGRVDLKKTHPAYRAVVQSLEDAHEALRAAELTMKSDHEIKTKRSTRQKATAQQKVEADPLREKRTDILATIISERILAEPREADLLVEELLREDPTHDPDTIILDTYLRSLHQLQDPEAFPAEQRAVEKTLDHINYRLGIYERLGVHDWVEFTEKMRSRNAHSNQEEPTITPETNAPHEQGSDLFAEDLVIGERLNTIQDKAASIEHTLNEIEPRFAKAVLAAANEQLRTLGDELGTYLGTSTEGSTLYRDASTALSKAERAYEALAKAASTKRKPRSARQQSAA